MSFPRLESGPGELGFDWEVDGNFLTRASSKAGDRESPVVLSRSQGLTRRECADDRAAIRRQKFAWENSAERLLDRRANR